MRRSHTLFLLALVACGSMCLQSSYAQPTYNSNVSITGTPLLCLGDCAAYEVVADSGQVLQVSWVLSNGTSIFANPFHFCGDVPGTFQFTATGFTSLQQTFTVSITVTVVTSLSPYIITTSAACPDSGSVCQKICAFGTATYELGGIPANSPVEWEVIGATSYSIANNKVTVEWGAPGQGQISAIANSGANNAPMQIFCGQKGIDINQPGGFAGVAFVSIFDAVSPATVAITGPGGYSFTSTGALSLLTVDKLPAGAYTVTVTDAAGNTSTCQFNIVLSDSQCSLAILPLEIAHTSGCDSNDGAISVQGIGGFTTVFTYLWNTGSTSPSISGLSPGTYSLTVADANNCTFSSSFIIACPTTCTGSTSLCVDILHEPQASIGSVPPADTGNVVRICQGQTVFFQNLSQYANSYAWDFGDFNTSAQFKPEHRFNAPGTYTVTLIARNECFCADTTHLTVEVLAAQAPTIECVGTVCEGETVTYTTNNSCSNYDWAISGGGVVLAGGSTADNYISVQWNVGPQGTISLSTAGCSGAVCNEPNVVPIPILSDNVKIQGLDKVCSGSVEEYFIPDYGGTNITWTVVGNGVIKTGQGTNRITVNWTGSPGVGNPHRVIVAFDNCYLGCTGRDTLPVSILPAMYVQGPIQVCQNTTTTYSSRNVVNQAFVNSNWVVQSSSGTTLLTSPTAAGFFNVAWNFPPGRYQVRATPAAAGGFCTPQYTVFVEVFPAPPKVGSIAGATQICPSQTYTFQASGLPQHNFFWTINNGGVISTQQGNPVNVKWGNTPPWSVAVAQIQTTGQGCVSDTLQMQVLPLPDATINGNAQICAGETGIYLTTFFENIDYQWSVVPAGAGTVVKGQGSESISVLWHQAGPASVRVSICGATKNYNVMVNPLPEPVVHDAIACAGELATVTTTVPFSGYVWENQNGVILSFDPSIDLGGGHYRVLVSDANGCLGDTTFFIKQNPPPAISITTPSYYALCSGGPPATLYASETGSGYDYQWFFNGAPVGTNAPTYSTNQPGDYQVVVTDVNGCTAASNILTLVDCEAVGGTCVGGLCLGLGGGPPLPACVPAGTIDFTFTNSPGDCNIIDFTNTSTNFIPGSFTWLFGDPASGVNNISTAVNPSHTYTAAGYYTVLLIGEVNALSPPGSSCKLGRLKDVLIPAVADFDFTAACPGAPVGFNDLSTVVSGATISDWQWDFGDPASGAANSSSLQNPTHTFANPGSYNVTLTVTSLNGCQTSASKTITTHPLPNVDFTNPVLSCEKTSLPFAANVSGSVTGIQWNFGDPASGAANTANQANTFHAFTAPGLYNLTVTATNVYGCTDSFSNNFTVTANTLSGNITASPTPPICAGDSTTLSAPAGGISWKWTSGASTPTIVTQVSGVYGVTLTDGQGCSYAPSPGVVTVIPEPNGIVKAVEYNEYGQPVAFFENSYSVCEGEDVYLVVQGSPGYSYFWSNFDTQTEISFTSKKGNLLPVGTHTYHVTVTDNASGCTSVEGPFTITVHPKPSGIVIASNPAGPLCENTTATLSVSSPQGGLNYVWNTGEQSTSITVVAGGIYFVRAINAFGCEGRSNNIEVQNAPDIGAVPSGCHSRCEPDTMCLPHLPNVVSYQWFLDGNPLPAPNGTKANPVFDQSGDYHVQLTDVYGCTSTSGVLSLDLYPGFGTIAGNVWFDVNGNGIIDAADTLVSGIRIILTDGGTALDSSMSDAGGQYAFINIPASGYAIVLDTANLPQGWKAVLASTMVDIVGCDDQESFDWLLFLNCQPLTLAVDLVACPGDSVFFNGIYIHAGQSATFNYTGYQGCDSTIIATVLVLPTHAGSLELFACPNGTVSYNGVPLSPGTQQDFVLTNGFGCDSIVTVTVSALPVDTTSLQFFACPNGAITYNGVPLPPGAQQTFTFTNVQGCDSVVQVSVAALTIDTSTLQLLACQGGTVDYNGVQLAPGAQQAFTLTNQAGCDSVVVVSVGQAPSHVVAKDTFACQGSSIVFNGQTVNAGQTSVFTFKNQYGCDSVVVLSVIALPPGQSYLNLAACLGSTVNYNGVNLAPGAQQDFIFTNQQGCDSTVTVTVIPHPPLSYDLDSDETCWNASEGVIDVLNVQGGALPYQYSLDGTNFTTLPFFDHLAGGQYTVVVQDANGCQYKDTVVVSVKPPMAMQATDAGILCGESIELAPVVLSSTPVVWKWQDGSTQETFTATLPGVYSFSVANDCEKIDESITVTLLQDSLVSAVYIPNAFSPNDDGINDCFQGFVKPNVQVLDYELKIFDRWGDMVFETRQVNGCWDGIFKGKKMKPAVFVYYLRMKIVDCFGQEAELFKEGGVHLIR